MSKITVCVGAEFLKPRPYTDLMVFTDLRNHVPDYDAKAYLGKCCKYAQEHNVYLVPTRFVVNNHLFSCLISPAGQIIGTQAATHLALGYKRVFQRWDEIQLIDTPFGKVFLAVDVDIFHPEVTRAAKLAGAQLVVATQYIDPYQYSDDLLARGVWNMAQQNHLFVVGVNNNTAAIAAPFDTTPGQTGYLVPPTQAGPIQAKLYIQKLERTEPQSAVAQLRQDLYHTHYLQLCRG